MHTSFATLVQSELIRLESHMHEAIPTKSVPSTFRVYTKQKGILSRYKTREYLGMISFIRTFLW